MINLLVMRLGDRLRPRLRDSGPPMYLIAAVLAACIFVGWLVTVTPSDFSGYLLLAMVAGPFLLWIAIRNPEWSLTLFAGGSFLWFLLPVSVNNYLQGYRTVVTVAIVFVVHIIAFIRVRNKKVWFKISRLEWLLIIFTTFMAFSLIWSENRQYGIWKVLLFASTTVFALMVVQRMYADSPDTLFRLIKVLAISSVIPVAVYIITAFAAAGWRGLVTVWSYDVRVMLSDTSSVVGMATTLMISVPCVWGLFLIEQKAWIKILYGLLLLACLYVILLTGRRAAFVFAMLAIGIIYLAVDDQHRRLFMRTAVLVAASLIAIWLVVISNPARFIDRSVLEDISYINRVALYASSVFVFWASPIIGTGIGGFAPSWYDVGGNFGGIVLGSYSANLTGLSSTRAFAHNVLLESLSELGLVGFSLFVLVSASALSYLKMAWRISGASQISNICRVMSAVGVATVLTSFSQAQFSGDLGTLSIGLWLGIMVAAVNIGVKDHCGIVRSKQFVHPSVIQ